MGKYQDLREQVQEETNANNTELVVFPTRVCGKWYGGGGYRSWALENPTRKGLTHLLEQPYLHL